MFTIDAIINALIVVVIVLVAFWLMGVLLVGVPVMILNIIKLVIGLGALAAILRILGVLK